MKPLCIDLFCGMFGWSQGWLELGGEVVGFDLEHHAYHGAVPPNASLVLQDVRTLHGSQFKDAALILASSPCQEFSYRAMPWKRAKALGPPVLGMELFAQAARIQKEASEAAGRHIPMIQENVRGAQKYVGRAQWHFGSYYLWGDVPALMPIPHKAHSASVEASGVKLGGGASWAHPSDPKHTPGLDFTRLAGDAAAAEWFAKYDRSPNDDIEIVRNPMHDGGIKNEGGSWFNIGSPEQKIVAQNPDGRKTKEYGEAMKGVGIGSVSWAQGKGQRHPDDPRNFYSGTTARKAASARIAKIPAPLARHIALPVCRGEERPTT